MKKEKSLFKDINIFLLSFLLFFIFLLFYLMKNTFNTLEKSTFDVLNQASVSGVQSLDKILDSNEHALSLLFQKSVDLELMSSENEIKKSIATQNLLKSMNNLASGYEDVHLILVYDIDNDTYLCSQSSEYFSFQEEQLVVNTLRKAVRQKNLGLKKIPEWTLINIDNSFYIYRFYYRSGKILIAVVPLDYWQKHFLLNDHISFLLLDNMGNTYKLGPPTPNFSTENFINEAKVFSLFRINEEDFSIERTSEKAKFTLIANFAGNREFDSFERTQILIIFFIIILILSLLLFIKYLRKVVYHPINQMLRVVTQIENGDLDCRLPADIGTIEFNTINNNINNMLDTMLTMRIKSYEEQKEYTAATLRYFQLQLKPHFFLNALTTIHSLSIQNRNKEIGSYVENLSSIIRYQFAAKLHSVPLKDEIEHIKIYIKMQQFYYPNCVFYFFDISDDVRCFPIPQLLLHTLIENIYKHAVSLDKLTTMIISANKIRINEGYYCCITVEDDGPGFPEDVLKMAADNFNDKSNKKNIGLYSLYRIIDLMYEGKGDIDISNQIPTGAKVRILLPFSETGYLLKEIED
jgi:sensor histidine kinase YesM